MGRNCDGRLAGKTGNLCARQLLRRPLIVMRRLHDIEKSHQVQTIRFEQNPCPTPLFQLFLDVGAHAQKSLRYANTLGTTQMTHISALQRKHGLIF